MGAPDLFLRDVIQRAFPNIPDHEADQFISIGEFRSYPPGVVLCREGATENTFYIIVDGRVEVSKVINASESRILKPLERGDFFGEYALIHEAPRSASITTMEPTTVLEIRRDTFRNLLHNSASVSLAMVSVVSRRLRENNELSVEDLRLKAGELADAYQRLAEMDFARRQFLTAIAHELRTPLTSANGFLQVIRMGMLQPDEMREAIDTAAVNLQKIVSLVNDILFLQEMELILQEPEAMNIALAVKVAVNSQRKRAEESGVLLDYAAPDNLPAIQGDAKSLERVFAAMIENAVKFSPNGGDVNVSVAAVPGGVEVCIQDHGVGIPPESLPHIFNRFYHLDTVGEHIFGGLGIGLSIAHQVISQHGGSISVESEPNRGSTFTIFLPFHPPSSGNPAR
jgi:signal transduction histidine kinase